MDLPRVVIVGAGRAGVGVGLAMAENGIDVTFISRRPVPRIGIVNVKKIDDIDVPKGDGVFIIAVPDHLLLSVTEDLFKREILGKESIVGHLSGALTSSCILEGRELSGRFSAHPLFSFPLSGLSRPMPKKTVVVIEGDERGFAVARELFEKAQAQVHSINPSVKPLYHAGAVACANLPTVLVAWAGAIFKKCGVPNSMGTAAKLLESVASNLADNPASSTVTGPFARGDAETIAKNLASGEQWNPDFGAIYRFMGGHLADWLRATKVIGEKQWKEIKEILKPPPPPPPKEQKEEPFPWWKKKEEKVEEQEKGKT